MANGILLHLKGTPEGVEDNGSLTRVAAFPIGIDPERFVAALERPDVRSNIAKLLTRYAGRKVGPSVPAIKSWATHQLHCTPWSGSLCQALILVLPRPGMQCCGHPQTEKPTLGLFTPNSV